MGSWGKDLAIQSVDGEMETLVTVESSRDEHSARLQAAKAESWRNLRISNLGWDGHDEPTKIPCSITSYASVNKSGEIDEQCEDSFF